MGYRISKVRVASNPNVIVITVKRGDEGSSAVFLWNVEEDYEVSSHGVTDPYFVAFDSKSRPYIIDKGKVYFVREQARTNVFDYSMNSVKRLCDDY